MKIFYLIITILLCVGCFFYGTWLPDVFWGDPASESEVIYRDKIVEVEQECPTDITDKIECPIRSCPPCPSAGVAHEDCERKLNLFETREEMMKEIRKLQALQESIKE